MGLDYFPHIVRADLSEHRTPKLLDLGGEGIARAAGIALQKWTAECVC